MLYYCKSKKCYEVKRAKLLDKLVVVSWEKKPRKQKCVFEIIDIKTAGHKTFFPQQECINHNRSKWRDATGKRLSKVKKFLRKSAKKKFFFI